MVGTGSDGRRRFRPEVPSPARIYDYLLGGKDNYPADREAAQELLSAVPDVRAADPGAPADLEPSRSQVYAVVACKP